MLCDAHPQALLLSIQGVAVRDPAQPLNYCAQDSIGRRSAHHVGASDEHRDRVIPLFNRLRTMPQT